MVKCVSIRRRGLALIGKSVLCTAIVSVGLVSVLSCFHQKMIQKNTAGVLVKAINEQADRLLASFLLPEQHDAIGMILDRIKTEEGLVDAKILNAIDGRKLTCVEEQGSNLAVNCVMVEGGNSVAVAPITEGGNIYGYLYKVKENRNAYIRQMNFYIVFVVIGVLLCLFVFQSVMFSRLVENDVVGSLKKLLAWIQEVSHTKNGNVDPAFSFSELQDVGQEVLAIINVCKDFQSKLIFEEVAHQVAHDIRSPLAALEVAAGEAAGLPEEPRLLIRNAVARIRDIANDLVERGRKAQDKLQGVKADRLLGEEERHVTLLSPIVEELVSEKRLQFRSRLDVSIESHMDEEAYGLFATIQPREFKRVLSNLVNNAVEAMVEEGRVDVEVNGQKDNVIITVRDTGRGIPEEILPKLMQKGSTFGKEKGTGLGLYHAKETVEGWGGSVAVASKEGEGTTITITLPLAPSPDWFVPELRLAPNSTVVVIDDDISIHQIWENRLARFGREHGIQLEHFSTVKDVSEWYRQRPSPQLSPTRGEGVRDLVFLVDYELLGQPKTGLDIVEDLGIADKTILVTSRYEEPEIRVRCERLGIRLIPKPMAGFVPVTVTPSPLMGEGGGEGVSVSPPSNSLPQGEGEQNRYILIDDDVDLHIAWQVAARAKGVSLKTYATPEAFYADESSIAADAKIYVDSKLGDGVKGEDVSKILHDKGYTDLYLATGYSDLKIEAMPWLKGIVGKSPPWPS